MKNKTLRRVIDLARPHRKTIIIVSLLSLIVSLTEIAKPYLVKIVIDQYLSARNLATRFFLYRDHRGNLYWSGADWLHH